MDLKELFMQANKQPTPTSSPGKLLEVAKQKAPAPEPKKVVRPARVEKTDEWVQHLTEKANTELDSTKFGGARVRFNIVRSKDKWTALTPYLVYEGEEKKAPYRANAGFCTDKEYGPWLAKLQTICEDIHNSVPRQKKASGVARSVSKWTKEIENIKAEFGGEAETQVVSGKLNVAVGETLVTLTKDKEGNIYVTKGKGDVDITTRVLKAFVQ